MSQQQQQQLTLSELQHQQQQKQQLQNDNQQQQQQQQQHHQERQRRLSLFRKAAPALSSYQATPISKHYELNNQILNAFELHYENKLYRVAYTIGLRFVETALLEIPKHGYFYSSRHRDELMASSLEAIRVTHILQEMQQTDPELAMSSTEQIRLQKLQHLALEQQATVQHATDSNLSIRDLNFNHLSGSNHGIHNNSGHKTPSSSLIPLPAAFYSTASAELVKQSTSYEKQRAAVEAELSLLKAPAIKGQHEEFDNFFLNQFHDDCSSIMATPDASTTYLPPSLNQKQQLQRQPNEYNQTTMLSTSDAECLVDKTKTQEKDRFIDDEDVFPMQRKRAMQSRFSGLQPSDFDLMDEPDDKNYVDHDFINKVTAANSSSGSNCATASDRNPTASSSSSHANPLLRRSGNSNSSFFSLTSSEHQALASTNELLHRSGHNNNHDGSFFSLTAPNPPAPIESGWTISQLPVDTRFGNASLMDSFSAFNNSTTSFNDQLAKALYLSGLEFDAANAAKQQQPPQAQQQYLPQPRLPTYNEDYDDEQSRPTKPKRPQHVLEKQEGQPEQSHEKGKQQQQQQQQLLKKQESDFSCFDQNYQTQPQEQSAESAIQTIQGIYHEDFDSYRDMGRIRISHVDTYQGKIPHSTNGCTVIAPLLCIHHFMNTTDSSNDSNATIITSNSNIIHNNSGSLNNNCSTSKNIAATSVDPGLPDSTIIQVIEDESPSILPKIRDALGLVPNAFLIPSDAHDYLIKNELLSQEQFVTVCGGNILNEDHLNAFITTLSNSNSNCMNTTATKNIDSESTYPTERLSVTSTSSSISSTSRRSIQLQQVFEDDDHHGNSSYNNSTTTTNSNSKMYKKVAATLFFHEHVIAILKLQRSPGCYWYDIIDSLPNAVTLMRKAEHDKAQQKQQQQQSYHEKQNQQLQQQQQQQQSLGSSSWDDSCANHSARNSTRSESDAVAEALRASEKEAAAVAAAEAAEAALYNTNDDDINSNSIDNENNETKPINTTRIRCLDETALTVALRWYACSRFNEQNLNYIDMYPWDDTNSDFDPRIFQAFIWTEA